MLQGSKNSFDFEPTWKQLYALGSDVLSILTDTGIARVTHWYHTLSLY